jgi:hypothetical protein
MHVDTQGGNFVENVAWDEAHVVFGTLNIPGSNNDWLPWFGLARTQSQVDEVNNRTNADLAWLGRIFHEARRDHSRAVVLGIQADMWDPAIEGDPTQYDHFQPLVQALATQALGFRGEVLLLNGDSHQFTDDHPLADPRARRTSRSTGSHRTCRTCTASRSMAAPRLATSGCGCTSTRTQGRSSPTSGCGSASSRASTRRSAPAADRVAVSSPGRRSA